ncbi:tetratricopeptide repeat protein [Nocardia gipuzkoensis]
MTVGGNFIVGGSPESVTPLADLVERHSADGVGLPRMEELDPYLLYATPTQFGQAGHYGTTDRYVPRIHNDVDARLGDALATDRLVVVVGPSKAGKTRSLFEAVHTHLPHARVVVPAQGRLADIAACPEFVDLEEPAVVWLENLDRFLTGSGALDPALLTKLTARAARTVVVATLRSEARARLRTEGGELTHDTRVLLQEATEIRLAPTSNSPEEQARAAEAYPGLELGDYGLAEVLAGAPELLQRYDDAQDIDPVLWTVIRVAIDWARIGQPGPIPETVLTELADTAAVTLLPHRDVPDSGIREAVEAARNPVPGVGRVSALLTQPLPDGTRAYRPFDYLIAADDGQHHPVRPIPDDFWYTATTDTDPDTLFAVAYAAYLREKVSEAETLLRRSANAGHPGAMYNLGALLYEQDKTEEAETLWRAAANAGHPGAMYNLGALLDQRGKTEEAETLWRAAANAGDPGAMYNLGHLLNQQGKTEEAETLWRAAANAGHPGAMYSLGLLLDQRGKTEEAETLWRAAANAGHPDANYNLGLLLYEQDKTEEAETLWRAAADAGDPDAMYNLGLLLNQQGKTEEAEILWCAAADTGHLKAINALWILLQRGETG